MAVDWGKVKIEYTTTNATIRELAEKYNVSSATVGKHCKEENWVELKRQNKDKTYTRTAEKVIEKTSEKKSEEIVDALALMNDFLKDCRDERENIAIGKPERTVFEKKEGKTNKIKDDSSINKRSKLIRDVIAISQEIRSIQEATKMQSIANEGIKVVYDYGD